MTEHDLKFYASAPHECGYLLDQSAVSLFADPNARLCNTIYGVLIDHGFRRSGEHVYRPYCENCEACVPVRLDTSLFQPNRQQRRNWKTNQDLEVKCKPASLTEEHFFLYQKYISTRHAGGSMDNTNFEQFSSFILADWCPTELFEFRLNDKLVAVAITDVLKKGLSAFYTFFDPEISQKRSLGRNAILWQINEAKKRDLQWLYLGYYISSCDKMNYKTEYQPLQMFFYNRWVSYQEPGASK